MENHARYTLSGLALGVILLGISIYTKAEVIQFGTPKGEEGTRIFKATEHPNYSGGFHLKGEKATLVGGMQDHSPWDHLDYAGRHLIPVKGIIDINVNERSNTGLVTAEFAEDADRYRIVFDRFVGAPPYQD